MVKNSNMRFLLLVLILADQLADLSSGIDIWWPRVELRLGKIRWQIYPPLEASHGQEWQFQISTVRAHIGRSLGRPTPIEVPTMALFRFLLFELILADQVAPADHLAPVDHLPLHLQIYPPLK